MIPSTARIASRGGKIKLFFSFHRGITKKGAKSGSKPTTQFKEYQAVEGVIERLEMRP